MAKDRIDPESRKTGKKDRRLVKVYVTAEEKRRIADLARDCGLSVSSYGRRLCLGHVPRSALDARRIRDLMKVNGDQGRIGGLLKLYISSLDRAEAGLRRPNINRLLGEIEAAQERLRELINAAAFKGSGA